MISGPDECLERLRADFLDFSSDLKAQEDTTRKCDIKLIINLQPPPYGELPHLGPPAMIGNAFSYDQGNIRYNDYHDQGLSRYDFSSDKGEIWCDCPHQLYELLYLLIHSRLGEHWERRGLYRLHGLAFSLENKTILVLAPEGGGKTSLFLRLKELPGIRLLSDDLIPVRQNLELLPFPTRFRLTENEARNLAPLTEFAPFIRKGRATKYLASGAQLGINYGTPGKADIIICATRRLNGSPVISPLSTLRTFRYLIRDLVIGWGLPQMVEYFLRQGCREWSHKLLLAINRSRLAARLAYSTSNYFFMMGRKTDENARTLYDFLKDQQIT